jgi:ABC-type Fe3+/spermidine/putrescine transport system ATPase subunit
VLDIVLRAISARTLRDVTITFPKSTHTAVAGPPACGASTLLNVIAGTIRPDGGDVLFGSRVVTALKPARRPLLHVTGDLDAPSRWSVGHALIAAVRTRSLDREDRRHEYELALDRWRLSALTERRIDTLSSSERTRVQLARIELLRPAILLADRLFEHANPTERLDLADDFYRLLRVLGTTVISAPSTRDELASVDRVAILSDGRLVQHGTPATLFAQPADDAVALALGEVNVVPVMIRGNVVESVIGSWELADPPFAGSGIALVRPDAFTVAGPNEESDLIFGIEEASFRGGAWHCRGVLSGNVVLRVVLPRRHSIHKGKLLALRYDPAAIRLIRREVAQPGGVPTDVVPPMRESR